MTSTEKITITSSAQLSTLAQTTADVFVTINIGNTVNSATLLLPVNPIDGQSVLVSSRIAVTTLVLNASGRTVNGGVSTLIGTGVVGWYYELSDNSWYPYSNPVLPTPTQSQIGLGNVDNTSDANKPISSATQTALNGKLATNGNGGSLTGLTATQVGLGNVNNTADSAKPVSTAQQTALDAKQATLVSATNIKTVNGASILGSGDLAVNQIANVVYTRVSGSDATTTGQALVDIAGLVQALVANAVYEFEAVMSCTVSAVTTGISYGVNFSAAGATIEANIVGASSTTATKAERISILNTATTAFMATSGQSGGINIRGIIVVGANAGSISIKHLKITSGTSTVRINSFLRTIRIS